MGKKRADKHSYFRALVDECLQDLGKEVHHFRNLRADILESQLGKEIPSDLLFLVDTIYQSVLDNIFDNLSNANDLHVAHIACDGLAKSLLVRRGFVKKIDVL